VGERDLAQFDEFNASYEQQFPSSCAGCARVAGSGWVIWPGCRVCRRAWRSEPMVLLAADGVPNAQIARTVGVSRPTVIGWPDRYV
jgi:hypothetical protein